MGRLKWCDRCSAYHWDGEACFPEWLAVVTDPHDDEQTQQFGKIYARTAYDAAKAAAECWLDYVEYAGFDGYVDIPLIVKKNAPTAEPQAFVVAAEAVVEFRPTEK